MPTNATDLPVIIGHIALPQEGESIGFRCAAYLSDGSVWTPTSVPTRMTREEALSDAVGFHMIDGAPLYRRAPESTDSAILDELARVAWPYDRTPSADDVADAVYHLLSKSGRDGAAVERATLIDDAKQQLPEGVLDLFSGDGPGKFERCSDPALAAAIRVLALEGLADEESGDARARGHATRIGRFVLVEDNAVFLTLEIYDSAEEAREAVEEYDDEGGKP